MTERKLHAQRKADLEKVSKSHLPKYVSPVSLAERLEMTSKAVRELGLPHTKVGRRSIRYKVSDIEAFLAKRERKGYTS